MLVRGTIERPGGVRRCTAEVRERTTLGSWGPLAVDRDPAWRWPAANHGALGAPLPGYAGPASAVGEGLG
jgi:hypothetical protein